MVQLLFPCGGWVQSGSHARAGGSSVSFLQRVPLTRMNVACWEPMGSGPLSCSGVVPHHHPWPDAPSPPAPCNRPGCQRHWRPLHPGQRTAEPESSVIRNHCRRSRPALAGFAYRRKHNLRQLFAVCGTAVVVRVVQQGCSARGGQLLPDSSAASGCGATTQLMHWSPAKPARANRSASAASVSSS